MSACLSLDKESGPSQVVALRWLKVSRRREQREPSFEIPSELGKIFRLDGLFPVGCAALQTDADRSSFHVAHAWLLEVFC